MHVAMGIIGRKEGVYRHHRNLFLFALLPALTVLSSCLTGDAGGTAGFQRVLGPFVAAYMGQLAGRLEKEDWMRTGGWQ